VPGRKVEYDMTYLTALVTYRGGIVSADNSQADAGIPDIRLDIDATKQVIDAAVAHPPKYEVSARGYNGHLELYVQYTPGGDCEPSYVGIIDGLLNDNDESCHADVRVWAWGAPYDSTVPGKWCLVHEQSVVTDTLIALRNIPNTKYRVTISKITGGTVNLLEQHTV